MYRILLVFVFLLSAIGGTFFYLHQEERKIAAPAHFLPEDILFYAEQKEINNKVNYLVENPLGKTLLSMDHEKLALDLGASLKTVETIRRIKEVIYSDKLKKFTAELFYKECGIAMLRGDYTGDPESFLKNNLIVFAESRHSSTVLQAALGSFAETIKTSSSYYGKYIIFNTSLPNKVEAFSVFVGKRLIIAFSSRTLRSALDRYDEKKRNLSENFFFNELRNEKNNTNFFSFFNIDAARDLVDKVTDIEPSKKILITHFLSLWRGFTAGAYSIVKEADGSRGILQLSYNQFKLQTDSAHFLNIKPEKDKYISCSPDDTLLYYRTNTFDLPAIWKMYKEKSGIEQETLKSFEELIALTSGVEFDLFLQLADNNFHFILNPPASVDPLPLPNFTLIFELRDSVKAEEALQQLLLFNKIPHGHDIYRGIPFKYWGHEMQKGLQPVYAFHDNAAYFSTSVKTLIKVIDTLKDGKGLVNNDVFTQSCPFLLLDNNSSGYVNIPNTIDILKGLIHIGESMYSVQNRKSAYKARKLVYEIIFPILDGMKTYSNFAARTYFENGRVTMVTNITSKKYLEK